MFAVFQVPQFLPQPSTTTPCPLGRPKRCRPSRATWDECGGSFPWGKSSFISDHLRSSQIANPILSTASGIGSTWVNSSSTTSWSQLWIICTHHKNSGSNWKPACTLPLLPRCPTLQDGQPDPLGSKSRASNGSADSRGDSVRAATEPDWCGVALVPRTVFSRCGQSALAAVRVHVWSRNNHGCQGFRLQSCLVHSIQLGSKLFGPRKIKSHNTYKSHGKKSYGNIRMMPLKHGGRFDHGRHLLLDAAMVKARWPQGVTMVIWMSPEKSVNLLLGEVLPSNSHNFCRYFPTSMIVGRKEARRPSWSNEARHGPQKLRDWVIWPQMQWSVTPRKKSCSLAYSGS